MTSLNLIGKGKINQRATLLLLDQLEQLRNVPIQNLVAGQFQQKVGVFRVEWNVKDDVPYFGVKQIQCRVIYETAASLIVESTFYRSE